MNRQSLRESLWANEDTTKIEQTKKQFPAEIAFLNQKPYRPIRLPLEELQRIASALKKGQSHE